MRTHLTTKEQRVCDLIAAGLTNKDIARHLGIGYRTVEDYRANIYRKLRINEETGNKSVLLVRKLFHLDKVA